LQVCRDLTCTCLLAFAPTGTKLILQTYNSFPARVTRVGAWGHDWL
jgi:hypothetical protein